MNEKDDIHESNQKDNKNNFIRTNLLTDEEDVSLEHFYDVYGSRIVQDSEKLFLNEFLYPLLGSGGLKYIIPQYPFIDSEGRLRRIDFAVIKENKKIALEINGETYHAEGIIPNEMFDDNLQRQNEILNNGWYLQRFSYNQLLDPRWRKIVKDSLHKIFYKNIPQIISESSIKPNYLQEIAMNALNFYRDKGWKKGIVILPTGTGKTFLSAFDAKKFEGKVLFIVHRLDILNQSKDAYEKVWSEAKLGLLTGESKENVFSSRVLFASKDTLRNNEILTKFKRDEFDYIIIDEVHHGHAPSYKNILNYFEPKFLLGITATPDRMDRKDIFELFDYKKIFEFTLNQAIEDGFLVPYSYHGLKDNIDYSKIRYNGKKYNIQDLDKYLIIKERNEKIFEEYLNKGKGNKAIGFCCSIKHANDMADYFNSKGIPSVSINSETENRKQKIEDFRKNKYAVAFTVDIFNEGIDFPEVRVLLFLRPTESKTVFLQQLGRGLRLCSGKEKVTILDFIGNYKKANNIRKYLSKSYKKKINDENGRIEKIIYEYSPKCEVNFEDDVEEILDNQDLYERDITKEDLIDAYYTLTEKLGRKPTQQDINTQGEFKVSKYLNLFGSWIKFLRELGEFTEASYHYPQGLHLGHLLYIIKVIGSNNFKNTNLDDKYIRLRGNLDSGRLGTFQRQTKYKLQGLMEMGILVDDRTIKNDEVYQLKFTPDGLNLYKILYKLLNKLNFKFNDSENDIPSWNMDLNPIEYNKLIWEYIKNNQNKKYVVRKIFMKTHAVSQMLNYLYRIERNKTISRNTIYEGFFKAPFVSMYCEQNGINIASDEGSKHRCPFLLNVLHSIGILEQDRSSIFINEFLVSKETMELETNEGEENINHRIILIKKYINNEITKLPSEEESKLKETFGKNFLTKQYFIKKYSFLY